MGVFGSCAGGWGRGMMGRSAAWDYRAQVYLVGELACLLCFCGAF